jgi:transcriptional/translational regulatory protein YebC/TACO1
VGTGDIEVDALMEAALEAGAEDVVEGEDHIDVVTTPADFESVRDALGTLGFEASNAEISMEPSTTVSLTGKDAEQMLRLLDALEDLDDVQNVYANFEISDEEMAKFA